ncbi:MAG: hypothetical protein VX593_08755, partial [Pseudomonadota bacterium]|nr:hypothetical protein [Pseudomonadota bacterium]
MADLKSTHRNPLPRIAELDIRLNDDSENKPLHTCIRIGTEELEHDEFCLRIGLREAVLELAVEGYDVNQHGRLGEVSLDHVAKVAHSQSTSSSTARQTKKGISAKGAIDGSILKGQANAT